MIDLIKHKEESKEQYLWRINQYIESGEIKNWEQITSVLNEQIYNNKKAFGESAYRKQIADAKRYYEKVFSHMISDEYATEIRLSQEKLYKERVKLQTVALEYHRSLREQGRDELLDERIIEAIKTYMPKPIIYDLIPDTNKERVAVLNIADCHFGKEFKIYGLRNEVINEYSPEIFYKRMNIILSETLSFIKKEGLTKLYVFNLGDHIEGFIRHEQLWNLRYGAVDSAIIFGNYMGDWLHKLSKDINVLYHQTDGNHDELRLLDGKKGAHLNDSAGKIVKNCIQEKNINNLNFTFVENKTGFIFNEIAGFNIMGIHGEVSNLSQAIKDYSDIYDIKISYLIAGHHHYNHFMNCGVRKGCIGVGSVVGSDDFSMLLRKSADGSATIIVFEVGRGKIDEHTILLN